MTTFTRTLGEILIYTLIISIIIAVTCYILAEANAIPMEWSVYSTVAMALVEEIYIAFCAITE